GAVTQRAERGEEAGLPIDQRAVAVEAQSLEIGKLHGERPSGRSNARQDEGRHRGAGRPSLLSVGAQRAARVIVPLPPWTASCSPLARASARTLARQARALFLPARSTSEGVPQTSRAACDRRASSARRPASVARLRSAVWTTLTLTFCPLTGSAMAGTPLMAAVVIRADAM